MSRKLELYLIDILEAIARLKLFTKGFDQEAYLNSLLVRDASFRNFMVIGEAVKQISDESRAKHPTVPWKSIAGLRDLLAHEYFRTDDRILWNVIEKELDPLKEAVLALLAASKADR